MSFLTQNTPTCQNIPIYNYSNDAWYLKTTIEGSEFLGDSFLFVKPKEKAFYTLQYNPGAQASSSGRLVIENPQMEQKHIIKLRGTNEPQIENVKMSIECSARKRTAVRIKARNPWDDHQVCVYSNLPIVEGKSTISIPTRGEMDYSFVILPTISGTFSKFLKFVGAENKAIIYDIELVVSKAPPEYSIDLCTSPLKAVSVNIELFNPAEVDIVYQVAIQGESVEGESQFTVPKHSQATYVLKFDPKSQIRQIGSINFKCDNFGEFNYELVLTSK